MLKNSTLPPGASSQQPTELSDLVTWSTGLKTFPHPKPWRSLSTWMPHRLHKYHQTSKKIILDFIQSFGASAATERGTYPAKYSPETISVQLILLGRARTMTDRSFWKQRTVIASSFSVD